MYQAKATATQAPLSARHRKRELSPTCATPGCEELRGEGRFCSEHAALLARVRDDLAAAGKRSNRSGGGTRRKQAGRGATCCNPHCWNARVPPAAYCSGCAEAGWTEEED